MNATPPVRVPCPMPEPSVRLYLITPLIEDPAAFASHLYEALAKSDVACVLLRFGEAPTALSPGHTELVGSIQARQVAALVVNDVELALALEADGVHVDEAGDLSDALRRLKPSRIVGVGALNTRDDAMLAGERDIDYLMFGDGESLESFAERLDRVAWWAEIFRVPCVAHAQALDEIEALAAAGAEFVALGAGVWDDPRGPAAAMADAMLALRAGESAYEARMAERIG